MIDVQHAPRGSEPQEAWWWLADRKAMDIGPYSGPRLSLVAESKAKLLCDRSRGT